MGEHGTSSGRPPEARGRTGKEAPVQGGYVELQYGRKPPVYYTALRYIALLTKPDAEPLFEQFAECARGEMRCIILRTSRHDRRLW